MTDENISAIRARLKFGSIDEFIQGYARYISSGGIFIPMTADKLKPRGATIRFQFLLGDGSTALLGEGRVHQVHRPNIEQPGAPVGLLVKFTKLSQSSKRIVDMIVELKQGSVAQDEPDDAPRPAEQPSPISSEDDPHTVPAPEPLIDGDSEAEHDAYPPEIAARPGGLDEPTRAGPDPNSVTPSKPITERVGPPLSDDAPTKQPPPTSELQSDGAGLFDEELDERREDDDDFFKLAESYASGEEGGSEGTSGEVELPQDRPEDELGEPFDLGLDEPEIDPAPAAPMTPPEPEPLAVAGPDHGGEDATELDTHRPDFGRSEPAVSNESEMIDLAAFAMSAPESISEPEPAHEPAPIDDEPPAPEPLGALPALQPPPTTTPESSSIELVDEEELDSGAPPSSFQGDGPMPPVGPRRLAQTEGGLQILAYDEFSATASDSLDAFSFGEDEGELDSMFDDIFGGGGDLFGGDGDSKDPFGALGAAPTPDTPPEPTPEPEPEAAPEPAAPIAQALPEPEPSPVELIKAPSDQVDDDALFGDIFSTPPADAPSHVEEEPVEPGEAPSAELSSLLDHLEDDPEEAPDVKSLSLQGPSTLDEADLEKPSDEESLAALLDMARKDLEEGSTAMATDDDDEGATPKEDLLDGLLGDDALPPPPETESAFMPLPEPKKQEKKRGLFSKFFGS